MRRFFNRCVAAGPTLRRTASTCLLCDTEVTDWHRHSHQVQHVAREAVCSSLVSPEKHDAMMKQLWGHIQLDFALIDEVSEAKAAKRRGRLKSSLVYIKQCGVLVESLVHSEDVVYVSDAFVKLAMVGDKHLTFETADRLARLLPKVSGRDLPHVTAYVLSQRHLTFLYDTLSMNDLLSEPSRKLTSEQKACVVLSVYGELLDFSRRPHSQEVANAAAADRLVLNVLATHGLENMASELVHHVMQKIVDEGTAVWNQFKEESASRLKDGIVCAPLAVSPVPHKQLNPVEETATVCARGAWMYNLADAPAAESQPLRLKYKILWSDNARVSTLDLTVPNSASKTAFFAPTMPRLSTKAKVPPKA